MFKSNISSDVLFHFTKSIEIVISILENGFYPRTAIEDVSFMLPNFDKFEVGIPMVCFTDIPLSQSENHRNQYGQFGVGLKKEWGINNGLNPILYILKGSEVYTAFNHLQYICAQNAQSLDKTFHTSHTNIPNEIKNKKSLETMNAFIDFASYIKEYSTKPFDDIKPFYDEREWRYVPPFSDNIKSKNGLSNRLLQENLNEQEQILNLNKYMEINYPIKFSLDDLANIVIPKTENMQYIIECFYNSKLLNPNEYIKKIVQL